eukprot:3704093-Rhodomonas_salina.1
MEAAEESQSGTAGNDGRAVELDALENSVLRVQCRLVLGSVADQPLISAESHIRGRDTVSLVIRDDLNLREEKNERDISVKCRRKTRPRTSSAKLLGKLVAMRLEEKGFEAYLAVLVNSNARIRGSQINTNGGVNLLLLAFLGRTNRYEEEQRPDR